MTIAKFFSGKKTYIIGLALVVYAVLGAAMGWIGTEQMTQMILEGLGLITLRAGVSKV